MKLRFDNTFGHARALAMSLPGVKSARFVMVSIGGGVDGVGIDTKRGGWVRYRFVIDPPLDKGCEAEVTISTRATVRARKASCSQRTAPLPRCRDFAEVWKRARERHPTLELEDVSFGRNVYGWAPNGAYASIEDNCE